MKRNLRINSEPPAHLLNEQQIAAICWQALERTGYGGIAQGRVDGVAQDTAQHPVQASKAPASGDQGLAITCKGNPFV